MGLLHTSHLSTLMWCADVYYTAVNWHSDAEDYSTFQTQSFISAAACECSSTVGGASKTSSQFPRVEESNPSQNRSYLAQFYD